ncbi:MAG: formate dehydrogenase accessory sulfurtransferase FdhD [Actinomycetota bacterium]
MLRTGPERPGGLPAARRRVLRLRDGRVDELPDFLAAEEPLEIRLGGERVAVTMRTPGHDTELAVGFLVGEGIVSPADVAGGAECRSEEGDGGVADVRLRPGARASAGWQRNFYATSSCGVCGKASIDAIRVAAGPVADGPVVTTGVLASLPDRLREAQRVFDRTGGLHAAGLFTPAGDLVTLREDVGRHNAVDKVVGRHALAGDLPLGGHVLLVSGRASFELVQKAVVAGIPMIAAVSAPSTLAVELAEASNATLVGFLRPGGFNVYTGRGRIPGLG